METTNVTPNNWLDLDTPTSPVTPNALVVDRVARQEAQRAVVVAAGIEWPATCLPEGTALWDSGEQRLRSDRAKWARLPMVADALPAITAALAAEDRKDFELPVSSLRLSPGNGRIVSTSNDGTSPGLGYSDHAFRQLIAQVPGLSPTVAPHGTAGVLAYLSNSERAGIVNARIGKAEPTVTLRTKLASDGARVAHAVLSERYGSITDLDVAGALSLALNGSTATSRLDYKPGDRHSRFEVIFPLEIPVKTFKVGDLHYAMIGLKNSETGEGSFEGYVGLFRAACANLTLSYGQGLEIKVRHIVNAAGRMRAAIRALAQQVEPLVETIQVAAQSPLPEKPIGDLFAAIAKKFGVGAERAKAWADTYERGYSNSPTWWGATSAITEAAQQLSWWGAQQEEEEIAAQLVQVRVLN